VSARSSRVIINLRTRASHPPTSPSPRRPARAELQRSQRILVLKRPDPKVSLSITTALLSLVVGFMPLVAAQLAQHPHDPIVVLVALAVPLAAALRRSRVVHVVADFGPLALLARGLGIRRLPVVGEVGGVDFGGPGAAVAGAGFGLEGDGGAILKARYGGARGVQVCQAVAVGEVGGRGDGGVEVAGGVEEAFEVGCYGAFGGGVVDVVEEAVEGCFRGVEVCRELKVVCGQGGHGRDGGVRGGIGAVDREPGAALAFVAALVVCCLDVAR
jgi:hypothetical protein